MKFQPTLSILVSKKYANIISWSFRMFIQRFMSIIEQFVSVSEQK